jgi:hypothetical protein
MMATVSRGDGNEIYGQIEQNLSGVSELAALWSSFHRVIRLPGSLRGRNREDWTLRAAQDLFGCASAQRIDKVPMALCREYHEIGMPPTLGR